MSRRNVIGALAIYLRVIESLDKRQRAYSVYLAGWLDECQDFILEPIATSINNTFGTCHVRIF